MSPARAADRYSCAMGVIDAYRNQQGKASLRHRLRVALLKLTPDSKLSPNQKFVRDGYGSKIFSSVPSHAVSEVLVLVATKVTLSPVG